MLQVAREDCICTDCGDSVIRSLAGPIADWYDRSIPQHSAFEVAIFSQPDVSEELLMTSPRCRFGLRKRQAQTPLRNAKKASAGSPEAHRSAANPPGPKLPYVPDSVESLLLCLINPAALPVGRHSSMS